MRNHSVRFISTSQRKLKATTGRKQPKLKYSILQYFYGYNKDEAHHRETAKDQFQQNYFETIDYFVVSLKERFEQPTFIIYAAIDSLLLSIRDGKTPDHNSMKMIQEYYSTVVDILSPNVEMLSLKQLFKHTPVVCFYDISDKLQLILDERELIPNIILLCNLLLINPATSATPESSFSLARRIKTWQRATMTRKRFNSLAILNSQT